MVRIDIETLINHGHLSKKIRKGFHLFSHSLPSSQVVGLPHDASYNIASFCSRVNARLTMSLSPTENDSRYFPISYHYPKKQVKKWKLKDRVRNFSLTPINV